jgi:hypothetical protein
MKRLLLFFGLCLSMFAQAQTPKPPYVSSKFDQLEPELPTPNNTRLPDGSPGPDYWQQRADYKIKVELDDDKQSAKGSETITYYNNSPRDLTYLWLQLDQNLFDKNSDTYKTVTNNSDDPYAGFAFMLNLVRTNSEGGYKIEAVKDAAGKPMQYVINKTMMRIDLPTPLKAKGGKITFSVDWSFFIVDAAQDPIYTRSGYEFFEKDKNYVYEMAQWFPRMCAYNDVRGWQNKQFMGRGEFTLEFGDYEVAITVPSDHIVAATGELQNSAQVLTPDQIKRLEEAKKATSPVLIVTQDEAKAKESTKATTKKTWTYKATNVRDFAWASSRKFIWDAVGQPLAGKTVLCMSYYPKEGNPLWGEVSTKAVAHTVKTYSKYTIDYPYPVAISVHGPVGGMEYPMISFNNTGRPEEDGTVDPQVRNSTITVIIHEVGHNFFPMIINSDERQWTWMDEGLNTFVQYLTEKEWDPKFPTDDALPKAITKYMKGDPKKLVPIMTNSESIPLVQFGPNGYNKPATALNILRETVMGRELFDKAFKEYAQRWAFKRPEPADLFRTMEDASAVDLDWFWRGWFYGTEPVDLEIENITLLKTAGTEISETNPIPTKDGSRVDGMLGQAFGPEKEKYLQKGSYIYNVDIKNVGGLVTPIIIEAKYKDGSNETIRIPAEIWRANPEKVTKTLVLPKEVAEFKLDPNEETADINTKNNNYPRADAPSKFDEMKDKEKKAEGGGEKPKEEAKKEEPKKEEPKKEDKKKKDKKKDK